MSQPFKVGDKVVYKKQKNSTSPGPRAKDIQPANFGEEYWYSVDKYWLVVNVNEDQTIDVVTRRGKRHRLEPNDQRLRHSAWWEKLIFGTRFPPPPETYTEPEALE